MNYICLICKKTVRKTCFNSMCSHSLSGGDVFFSQQGAGLAEAGEGFEDVFHALSVRERRREAFVLHRATASFEKQRELIARLVGDST